MASSDNDLDVIIIGAGFAGMYALHRVREDLGLRVRAYERGSDVGGTWYWNRYPGARCDVESMFYSYSFSPELEQEWDWTERFPAQPELLRYANHVADRFDLRRDISFETGIETATWNEDGKQWIVDTDRGEQVTAQYLITAVGCLSASRVPDFPGLDAFSGRTFHTGLWPHDGVDFNGSRVAVIGTGSSGIQAIPRIAEAAEHLTVFQRTPAFSLPARNQPLDPAEIDRVKSNYRDIRAQNKVSPSGVPVMPPIGRALEVAPGLGSAELDRRWRHGGTVFMTTFSDTVLDVRANEVSAQFVRERIHDIVDDAPTAELLTPRDYPIGAKRICLDTDYFATYNRGNVSLVSVKNTPIERITPNGVVVGEVEHQVDTIVFATGYDAMTGPLNAIRIVGEDGVLLRDKWADGPRTYLGLMTAGYPNLMTLTGPGSPSVLVNMFVSIEQHVDFVCDLLVHARKNNVARISVGTDVEQQWGQIVNDNAARTLFPKAASWYTGANIPGKPQVFLPFVGGMGTYVKTCQEVVDEGYRGFELRDGDGAVIAAPAGVAHVAEVASELTAGDVVLR